MADLIERDALMKKICDNECGSVCEEECENVFCNFYDYIMDAPAVNRWIPCSERLPDDFVWCLVCMSDGCIRLGKWNGEYDEQGVWWVSHPLSGGKLYRIKNVPFWMPLPEPPKDGGE